MTGRCPVMMGEKAKISYDELVRYYKFINKTSRVEGFLTRLFNKELKNLKENYSGRVCSENTNDLTEKQKEFLRRLDQKYAILNLDENGERELKIPLQKFKQEIIECFEVTGRDAINIRKSKIFNILNLKQIQEKDKYFVVHNKYRVIK